MQVAVSCRAMLSPPSARARRTIVTYSIAVAAVSAPARAQLAQGVQPSAAVIGAHTPSSIVLSGSVRDTNGVRIPFATVRWQAGSVVANDSGAFEVRGLPDGHTRFSVRRIGFEPLDFDALLSAGNPAEVVVELRPIPLSLTGVDVNADPDDMRGARLARVGFFDRRRAGRGTFYGPEELEQRNPQALSDIVASTPGVNIQGRRRSRAMQYYSSQGCRMNVFLDGHEVTDLGDDVLNGSDLKAIEVYSTATAAPPQFVTWDPRKGYCGSVVVWTK